MAELITVNSYTTTTDPSLLDGGGGLVHVRSGCPHCLRP